MKRVEVAAAIIQDGNKILATQRGYGEFKDGWEFPGGKIEPGETPEEALKREIREELETEIMVEKLVQTIEHEAAKWLEKEELDTVEWLLADSGVVEKLKSMDTER